MTIVFTEVHAEIRQVFKDNNIIFISQFAYDSKFLICQADPCRIVRVRIQNTMNLTCRENTFQFIAKFLATIFINVKSFHRDAEHLILEFMYRKTGVNKEDGVLFFVEVTAYHE